MVTVAKATSPQFTRDVLRKWEKSLGYDPKEHDLGLDRLKPCESTVEGRKGFYLNVFP